MQLGSGEFGGRALVETVSGRLLGKPLVVVGVPAFNEEKTIAKVVLLAREYADMVVVCDDGSSDMTADIAACLGADVVRHSKNLGYGASIQSLFRRARELGASVLVTLDGDGQHDPREIPSLIKPVIDGVSDVVVGSRLIDKNGSADMPGYRKLGVKMFTRMTNGSAANGVSDAQSGYRAYNKHALELLSLSEMGFSASIELLRTIKKVGLTVSEVPISCKYENSVGVKTSTKHPIGHGAGLLMSIIKFIVEDKPLMVLGVPGVTFLAVGTLFGVWLLNIYAAEHRIVTNIGLATLGFSVLGIFMVSTAITLYAITRLAKRVNGK